MKLMYAIPVILILLFAFCIYLVVFNFGSPKLYNSIFIGLSSFIASTFFVLQPDVFSKNFGISVAIVGSSNSPASIAIKDMNVVEKRQNRLAGFVAHYKNQNENTMIDEDVIPESIEYSLIEDFLLFGRTSEGFDSSDRGDGVFEVSTHVTVKPNYPTFKTIEVLNFFPELNKNRFFTLNLLAWDIQKVKLPKGTQIALIRKKDVKGLHIWKKHYFDIRMEIKQPSVKTARTNSVPSGFRSAKEISKSFRTENFNISLIAEFNRISSERPQTEHNKDWVKSLFVFIENNYSDLHNREINTF